MILGVIFIPPLYFLTRKKWGHFVINSFFYGCACLCIIVFALIFMAPFFWLIAFAHAVWNYKKEMANKQAEYLATKMAEKMRESASSGLPPRS
ncbi:MAG: hypothetical protein ABI042_11710 [Verrucomicrobiota bacterium]